MLHLVHHIGKRFLWQVRCYAHDGDSGYVMLADVLINLMRMVYPIARVRVSHVIYGSTKLYNTQGIIVCITPVVFPTGSTYQSVTCYDLITPYEPQVIS